MLFACSHTLAVEKEHEQNVKTEHILMPKGRERAVIMEVLTIGSMNKLGSILLSLFLSFSAFAQRGMRGQVHESEWNDDGGSTSMSDYVWTILIILGILYGIKSVIDNMDKK